LYFLEGLDEGGTALGIGQYLGVLRGEGQQ
jgi:hypothetical protein